METYEQLQLTDLPETASETSPSSRQGYPVNLTALQEKVLGIAIAATWSKSLSELSERFARNGSSLRIRPVYSQGRISDTSIELSTTYPRWGMVLPGGCGELVMSEPRTAESECSLYVGTPTATMRPRSKRYRKGRTPNPAEIAETFPTPLASDTVRMRYSEETLKKVGERRLGGYKKAGCNLSEYVQVYPTPQATSWGCSGARAKLRRLEQDGVITETERKGMQAGNGGKLNPEWVEWLQGFPIGWTDCAVSGTQ